MNNMSTLSAARRNFEYLPLFFFKKKIEHAQLSRRTVKFGSSKSSRQKAGDT
jgi:hypothetical protein